MMPRLFVVLTLLVLSASCGRPFEGGRMVQQFLGNRAFYEKVALEFWSKTEFRQANVTTMDPNDPNLTGLYVEPPELKNKISKETWKALQKSGIESVSVDPLYGGVVFVTYSTGISISGSERGFVVTFEAPLDVQHTDSIEKFLKDPANANKSKLILFQKIDDKAGLFFERT